MSRSVRPPTAGDLRHAARVVAQYLTPTPLVASPGLGAGVHLKLEVAQPTGSFKVRGALAALAAMPPGAPVVTASAGNHALGIAHAARLLGRRATVVLPTTASAAKLEALSAFGVRVVRHGELYEDAEAEALRRAAAGATFVSAYNDPHVIAGQATVAAELIDALPAPLTIVCPVGGGGLAAGVALAAAKRADVRVVGVEAAGGATMSAALAAGRVVPVPVAPGIADGLGSNIEGGSVTVDILRRRATAMVTVSEEEIAAAIRHLAARHGLVVEGAGAVATAAILCGRVPLGGTTVALVTGRNISLALAARLLAQPAGTPDAVGRAA